MRPPRITAMRSATIIASSWSWVTMTKLVPSFFCSRISSKLRLAAQLLVERGHRLVEQQHARALDQRARERHALALAAGELVDAAAGVALQLRELQHLVDALGDVAPAQAFLVRPKPMFFSTLRWGNSA